MNTFQALGVGLLALLPGASFTFSYERVIGSYGVSLSDRVVRLFVASAVFQALLAGVAYRAYAHVVVTGRLVQGQVSAWTVEWAGVAYVVTPFLAGSALGYVRQRTWIQRLIRTRPEPRAWDYVWQSKRAGTVRLRLKSGTWLAGEFSRYGDGLRSFAAGYPDQQDLFLRRQFEVDPTTGEFETGPDGGAVVLPSGGLLLRWDEIEYLEFMEV